MVLGFQAMSWRMCFTTNTSNMAPGWSVSFALSYHVVAHVLHHQHQQHGTRLVSVLCPWLPVSFALSYHVVAHVLHHQHPQHGNMAGQCPLPLVAMPLVTVPLVSSTGNMAPGWTVPVALSYHARGYQRRQHGTRLGQHAMP